MTDPTNLLSKLPLPAAVAAHAAIKNGAKVCVIGCQPSSLVELRKVKAADRPALRAAGFTVEDWPWRWEFRDPDYEFEVTIIQGLSISRPNASLCPVGTSMFQTDTGEMFVVDANHAWVKV